MTGLQQIKSKERVADHGEVYTAEREVNAMLNLVKPETERIEATFLEPACGNGNFLAEVLHRKLEVLKTRYRKDQGPYERQFLIAVGSLYGIDILQDNVSECIERLYKQASSEYKGIWKELANDEFLSSIKYVFQRNILCGDALTMKDVSGNPIVFSEWSSPNALLIKRQDFTFESMMQPPNGQPELFDVGIKEFDENKGSYVAQPIKDYPMKPVRKVYEYAYL